MGSPNYLIDLVRSTWQIARFEFTLFWRFPRLALAALAICLVPAVYALIYLSSVWDPNAKTNELPVGVVNLDEGFTYQGRPTRVGAELVDGLVKSARFEYHAMDDAQAAREAVRKGALAFAVIIPKDFSASAVPGERPGGGQVTVVLSEGNNYASAGFARRFAEELGHQVNVALNEKRWEQVLVSVDGSGKSLSRLQAGVAQLRTGANALAEGTARYSNASTQWVAGYKQLASGIRAMESKLPPDADLKSLKSGTQRLAARQHELGSGLEQLQAGARKLTAGATTLQEESAGVLFVGDKLAEAAGQLAAGGTQLTDGLTSAIEANTRLTRGMERVSTGTDKLADGVGALGDGVRAMAEKLPEDNRLDTLLSNGKALAAGAARLRAGVAMVESVLPASPDRFEGSAKGLADSVEPFLDVLAPVANNGSAFAPNMVAMALWLGALMAVYLFNMRLLPTEYATAPALSKALGKFAVPALLVLAQTVLTFLMLVFGLEVVVPHYLGFVLAMATAALAFLAMAFLLLRAFGEAGKLLAVLLLTLQLAAGGGVMPIELTGDFFQAVHDWLPFTWVIKTFRASLFGAYGNDWQHAWNIVVFSGVASLLLATFAGRWKTVDAADYKPGIEI